MAQTTQSKVKASTQYKRKYKSDYGREKIEILYEDDDIVVINKPSGMLSVPYPGSKARTAVEVLEKIMRTRGTFSASHKPFVVHRLDRDTSGVMLFALNESAQKKLVANWRTAKTERLYRAVAENPRNKKLSLPPSGTIDEPLAQNAYHVGYVPQKSQENDKQNVKTVRAITHFKTIERGPTHTLFELSLETGKKNQIRAHLSSKGYPLAGDENYRAHTDPFHRLALHARTLEIVHPGTGKKLRFEVPEEPAWAEYVHKGDFHPELPIWRDKSAAKDRDQKWSREEETVPRKRLSAKDKSHMDFIALGKLRNSHAR